MSVLSNLIIDSPIANLVKTKQVQLGHCSTSEIILQLVVMPKIGIHLLLVTMGIHIQHSIQDVIPLHSCTCGIAQNWICLYYKMS